MLLGNLSYPCDLFIENHFLIQFDNGLFVY